MSAANPGATPSANDGPVNRFRPRPDRANVERLGTSRIKAALWELPDSTRIAITLMDLCGFTAAQVAAITGAPRGTVLARVHRGRKALAPSLRDEREPAQPSRAPR